MKRFLRLYLSLCLFVFTTSIAFGQANGKLQIHYIDVGQGLGAVLISPDGQIVLFDDGLLNNCDKPVSYLQQLGITHIDYHITSHYHADHFGCAKGRVYFVEQFVWSLSIYRLTQNLAGW
ncbi:MAG: hypothetical protein LAO78_27630 [Acidobacteriia bacterium]|nr:hypothetical protein [Terriglobia bacterium]